ncbi:MAG: FtsW/RodA/SpoVE family cell cycle protein [Erysipelotrichia bacterium]|jgi:cell division protein FtsW|nr:FtsW/RodA/SpoVE family cell cycle protein [Erysipelotrichia bacterium]
MKGIRKAFYSIIFTNDKAEKIITFCVYFLLVIGILFTTSAAMNSKTTIFTTLRHFFKQFIVIFSGILVYHMASNIYSVERVSKAKYFLIFTEVILLMAAYFYCYVNGPINGSYSWIDLKVIGIPYTIQPSEFAKVTMILLISSFFSDKRFKGQHWFDVVFWPLAAFITYCVIIAFLQKDLGTTMILVLITLMTLLIPKCDKIRGFQWMALFTLCLIAFAYWYFLTQPAGHELLMKISPTVAARFSAVLNPEYHDDATREIFYSLLGISRGKLLGVGFGNSVQKFGYLVSSDADYIFAVIVEELGIAGILLVFIPYSILIYSLFYYAKRVKKDSGRVILMGTIFYLFTHFLFNVGGVSGLLPLTGVPLLLISRGGSALLSILFLLGLCQGVIASERTPVKKEVSQ